MNCLSTKYFFRAAFILFITALQFSFLSAQSLDWVSQLAKSGPTNLGNWGRAIALDADYNVYTVGDFEGTVDFDPGAGFYNLTATKAGGGKDVFVSKLDSAGNFLWAIHMGGAGYNEGRDIAIDDAGNCYITGMHDDTTDFDPGPGVANLIGFMDPYVAKYDPNGNLVWVKEFIGPYDDYGFSIHVSDSNFVYVTGNFGDVMDFDPGPGVANLTSSPNKNTFILKLNSSGIYQWAKMFYCDLFVIGTSIDTDPTGKVYVGGFYYGTADFDPGPATYNINSLNSRFVCKLTNAGNFIWANDVVGDLSNPLEDHPSISVDNYGNVYSAWQFVSTVDFNPGAGVANLTSSGNTDCYILKQDMNGNYKWAVSFGKSAPDAVTSVYTDGEGLVYSTGYAQGIVDFNPGPSTYNVSSTPKAAFISVLDSAGQFVWAGNNTATGTSLGFSITADDQQKIYVTGHFWGAIDFDAGAAVTTKTGPGTLGELFVEKLHALPIPPGFGVEDVNDPILVNIYPNPTTQVVTLDFTTQLEENAIVEIYNMIGQLMFRKSDVAGDNLILNFEDFENGIYVIQVQTSGSQNSWKVIKY